MSAFAAPFEAANVAAALRIARARSQSNPLSLSGAGEAGDSRDPRARKLQQRRLRDEDQEKLAASAQGRASNEVLQKAERDYAPESRSFQRDSQLNAAKDANVEARQNFRAALAQARGDGAKPQSVPDALDPSKVSEGSGGSKAQAATENKGKPEAAGTPAQVVGDADSRPAATASSKNDAAAPAASRQVSSPSPSTAPIVAAAAATAALAIKNVANAAPSAPTAVSTSTTAAAPRAAGPGTSSATPEAPAARATAARAVKTAPASPAESADPDANFERILRVIRGSAQQDRGVATVRLDPPELGMLRLKLDFQGDTLKLGIDTESEVARRLLSNDIDALRRELAHGGLHLEQVDVRVQPPQAPVGTDASSFLATDGGAGSQSGSAQTSGERSSSREHERFATDEREFVERGAEIGSATESLLNVLA